MKGPGIIIVLSVHIWEGERIPGIRKEGGRKGFFPKISDQEVPCQWSVVLPLLLPHLLHARSAPPRALPCCHEDTGLRNGVECCHGNPCCEPGLKYGKDK